MWENARLTKDQQTPKPEYKPRESWTFPRRQKKATKQIGRKKNQKWMLRAIFDISPADGDHENNVRNAKQKPARPAAPAMPCVARKEHHCNNCGERPCAFEQLRCFIDSERQLLQSHPNHIACKICRSLYPHRLVDSPVWMPKTMKIPTSKSCSEQGTG